ncbi:DUF6602 domain-containing protein [Polaribacter sp. PL03]|uniref:DUF6602 domain-containing protein n=1 Tax=Polaribacter sp. PL03 TaxID=3088353 RepID=UPI0029CD2620|nr:DUF6602 domain-containing protein [Polaribacter sp. PL03]MDX6748122.1 DUF6602 domain-containing protein [Polaribacter sp. PL03]
MIKTIADFITKLKENGIELIDKDGDVKHPGLIGDMYEGLTNQMLNKAIFENLDLKVVSGKINNNDGDLSSQVDCMIVVGEGKLIPFTNKYIYHYSQVIAVIEVKKTLNKQQLFGSYDNLKSIINVSRSLDSEVEPYVMRLFRKSWQLLTNTELPERENLDKLPEKMQYIYHTLLMEAYFPLRIVLGYFGYASELSLRDGFADMLDEKIEKNTRRGYGIGSFPNLIICRNNSLIKSNGMPFAVPFQNNEFYWPILLSSNKNPLLHLLEFIWTRLSYKFQLSSSIFDDELSNEFAHQFLDCKFDEDDKGNKGWSYKYCYFSKEDLNAKEPVENWEPAIIDRSEFILITELGDKEELYFKDEKFIKFLETNNINLEKVLKTLNNKRLVFHNENSVKLSTIKCITVFHGDKTYAGDDANGMMTKWFMNKLKK